MLMTERTLVPVILGITGKRDLKGADAAVGAAFRRIFDLFDVRVPNTPKIVLSALAEGADTVAAEEAVRRDGWQVIAPLPLSLDLYLQDFDPGPASHLRDLVAHPKVRSFALEPLRDYGGNEPLAADQLVRRDGQRSADRTAHYEQVGLYIAERCAILLAVMPGDEQPGLIGGTARIVDYRIRGELDADARDIVRRSAVLREMPPLDRPPSGPVWVIDLAAVDRLAADGGLYPFTVRLPADERIRKPATNGYLIRESLRLVDRTEAFNRRVLRIDDKRWERDVEQKAGSSRGDAAAMAHDIRLALSAIQMDVNRRLRSSLWLLAGFFAFAVLAFETYVELQISSAVLVYVALVLLALAVYWHARRQVWQPIAEDYRAVSEVLRVQVAWWQSGLSGPDHRVDLFYLRGASGSLGLVRTAIRHIVDAALLTRPGPMPVSDADRNWIDRQVEYFERAIPKRRHLLSMIGAVSWFLFVAGMVPAFFLALVALVPAVADAPMPGQLLRLPPGALFLTTSIAIVLIFWLSASISSLSRRPRRRVEAAAWPMAFVAGILLVVGLYDLAVLIAHLAGRGATELNAAQHLGTEFVKMAAIVPAAFAGALRYVAEKRSWEAEVHNFDETLEIFRRAQSGLSALDRAADMSAADKAVCRRRIVLELGQEALGENESWIRAHRERPLEPVVGG
jgi:hypothetical protein